MPLEKIWYSLATVATWVPSIPYGVGVSMDDKFVYVNYQGTILYSRNLTNGTLTNLGYTGSISSDMVMSNDNNNIYDSSCQIFSRNTTSGAATYIGSCPYPGQLVISQDGNSVYTINGNNIYHYDRNLSNGGIGSYTKYVSGMPSNTTIYARAYYINGNGTTYSSDKVFTTNP